MGKEMGQMVIKGLHTVGGALFQDHGKGQLSTLSVFNQFPNTVMWMSENPGTYLSIWPKK